MRAARPSLGEKPASGAVRVEVNGDNDSLKTYFMPAGGATSAMGLVSRVTPVQTAMRNCTRDEGRSFEVGNQVLISNHRKPLWSKAVRARVARCRGDFPRLVGARHVALKVSPGRKLNICGSMRGLLLQRAVRVLDVVPDAATEQGEARKWYGQLRPSMSHSCCVEFLTVNGDL